MANIYHGKAQSVKIDDNASMTSPTTLGYSKNVKITWEPEIAELMPGDLQVGGYGSVEIDIAESGSTNETALEALEGLTSYVEIEDPAGYTYVAGPFMLQVGMERDFSDPKNPHIYKIRGRKFCDLPNDFVTGPTAP